MAQAGGLQDRRRWELYLDERTYKQLRGRAAAVVRRRSDASSVRGDDLLQETLLRLVQTGESLICNNSAHFQAIVALRMGQVLLDKVRTSNSLRRGRGFQSVPLTENAAVTPSRVSENLIFSETVHRLGMHQARMRRVLELRMEENASLDEIAIALSVSTRTVKRDLKEAGAWMRREFRLSVVKSGRRAASASARKVANQVPEAALAATGSD